MSAETLRRAAALMRERATIAAAMREHAAAQFQIDMSWPSRDDLEDNDWDAEDADHIASWHPAVALAVAETLAQHADLHDTYDCCHEPCAALAAACAYLGESC